MGTETLPDATTVASGLLIKAADFLTTNAAMQGVFVGRNTSGVPTSGQSLGTSLYPWGPLFADSITIGGSTIDLTGITSPANRIVSGATRTTSGQPQFLDPDGSAASVDLLGAATNLVLSINSATATVNTDITISGLTVAPSTNNTCLINDTYFADQDESKYFGEIDSDRPIITIDTVGSEITGRVGQFISLKTGTSEIMFGWLKSTTEFVAVKRGYFFDSASPQVPIVRETIANNDTLTLMETGWIFVEDDGTTTDVTYLTPVYAYTAHSAPATGQYWYDISNVAWKRWSGSAWISVNRVPVGLCVIDASNCIAARSFDFYGNFQTENTIDAEVFSDEVVRSVETFNSVNVYGTDVLIENYPVEWDNTADMETGGVAADTNYYCYLSTEGQPFISTERPYERNGDLRGRYHPYNNWRYIFEAVTDYNSDWLSVKGSSTFDNRNNSADWEAEGLEIVVTSVTQATIKFKKLTILNSEGQSKTLYNGDLTADITVNNQGAELASTWYQIWIDSDWKLKLVPDLSGTATTNTLNKLVDTGATFRTYGAEKGDEAFNKDDNTKGNVDTNDSETQLGFSTDLFPDGNEDYVIHMLNPVGLGSFRSNIGAIYNDSGSDLATQVQIQRKVVFITYTIGISFNDTVYTKRDISPYVPVTAKEASGSINIGVINNPNTDINRVASDSAGNGETRFRFLAGSSESYNLLGGYSVPIRYAQSIYSKVDSVSSANSHDLYISGYRI